MLSMLLTWVALAVPRAGLPDDGSLTTIEQRFGIESRQSTEQALQALIDANPSAADRARVWLGNLALEDRSLDRAEQLFAEVTSPALDALGRRGLGDVAFARGRYEMAIVFYESGLASASGALATELRAKTLAAQVERRRVRIERACFLVYLAAAAWFASRIRGAKLGLPVEVAFLVPVYALFFAAAWTHGPNLRIALAWITGGSLLAVGLIFAAPARRRSLGDAALALAMHAALVYIAVQQSGLIHKLPL